jgi:hypothetical protein
MAKQRYGFLADGLIPGKDGLNLGKDQSHAAARRGVAARTAIDVADHRQ